MNENRPRTLPGSEAARARAAETRRNVNEGLTINTTTAAAAASTAPTTTTLTRPIDANIDVDDEESESESKGSGEEADPATAGGTANAGVGGPGDPVFEARIAALSAEIAAAIVQAQVRTQTVLHSGGRFGGGEGEEEEEEEEENDELEEDELEGEDEEVFNAASSVLSSVAPTSLNTASLTGGVEEARRVYTYPPPPVSATIADSQSRSTIQQSSFQHRQQHQHQQHGQQKRMREMSALVDSGRETEEDFPAPLRELKRKKLFVD